MTHIHNQPEALRNHGDRRIQFHFCPHRAGRHRWRGAGHGNA